MQESPSYSSYLSRFQNLNLPGILDGREIISGSDRRFLESVYARLKLYFQDEDFRSQISLQKRQFVEDNYITNIFSYLETIFSWQQDGATQINGANLQSQVNNIAEQTVALDTQISGYYYTYFSNDEPLGKRVQEISALIAAAENERDNLKNVVENVKDQVNGKKDEFDKEVAKISSDASESLESKKKAADKTLASISTILDNAKLLAGIAGGHKLANYYQKLSNGRTTDENDNYTESQGKKLRERLDKLEFKKIAAYFGIAALATYPLTIYILTHEIKFDLWSSVFILIILGSVILFGITYAFIQFLQAFNNYYRGGHARSSAIWMIGAIAATIVTAVYSSVLVHDLSANGKITWEEIIPKIIVLLAPAYLVRLCIQNYRANAHLQVQYMHRATIVSIAETYSDATALKDPRDQDNDSMRAIAIEAKMQILTEAARVMFAQSESGFITQKEGAGNNGDNPMDTIQNTIKLK